MLTTYKFRIYVFLPGVVRLSVSQLALASSPEASATEANRSAAA